MCRTLQTRWQEPQTAPDLHAPTHEPGSGIVGGTTGVSGMTPRRRAPSRADLANTRTRATDDLHRSRQDRKSTRLNSSHVAISYAVLCLQKKKRAGDGRRTAKH